MKLIIRNGRYYTHEIRNGRLALVCLPVVEGRTNVPKVNSDQER